MPQPVRPIRAYFITVIQPVDYVDFDMFEAVNNVQLAFQDEIEFIMICHEIGGELGTPHYHMLVVFNEPNQIDTDFFQELLQLRFRPSMVWPRRNQDDNTFIENHKNYMKKQPNWGIF